MAENGKHLLLVEDDPALREAVAERLADHDFLVTQVDSGEAALERLADFAFDIVVTDLRLPGIDGTRVVEDAMDRYPEIIGVVITGYGTVRDAVDVMKRGAADFILKPFQFDELLYKLGAALERRRLKTENAYLRSQLEARYRFEGIIGQSPSMQTLFRVLETVAPTSSTILITGETGTGKELVARAIHHNSPRRPHRFLAINCSAIPETLLEAELFGHVRGAFTGAVGSRQGRFEQAHRGTLFLDEIGAMGPPLQSKLLRVLQEREFERLGDNRAIKIDVRVIAATNSELARMVAEGSFREDLFYRLNVIPVHLPPLRERRDDIPLLARHFLARIGSELVPRRAGVTFSQEAMRRLMAYPWIGNVRELENIVERMLALTPGRAQLEVSDLPTEIQRADPSSDAAPLLPDAGIDFEAYISGIERTLIHQSLERTGGNKGRAARLLNLKRTTFIEKLKRLERPH